MAVLVLELAASTTAAVVLQPDEQPEGSVASAAPSPSPQRTTTRGSTPSQAEADAARAEAVDALLERVAAALADPPSSASD